LYFGDQGNTVFLREVIDKTGGDFDIIVDNGGHTMSMQILSLKALWPSTKPGGIYFIEDLETLFISQNSSDASSDRDPKIKAMAKYLYELMDDEFKPSHLISFINTEMRGIECQTGICALFKKELWVL
ncbi:hypothetical protein JX266_014448, partial [Neoarthrinium moseri]